MKVPCPPATVPSLGQEAVSREHRFPVRPIPRPAAVDRREQWEWQKSKYGTGSYGGSGGSGGGSGGGGGGDDGNNPYRKADGSLDTDPWSRFQGASGEEAAAAAGDVYSWVLPMVQNNLPRMGQQATAQWLDQILREAGMSTDQAWLVKNQLRENGVINW